MLDLNLLRVFDEVMAERSLTRAARNLSLTQPAVSNAQCKTALDNENLGLTCMLFNFIFMMKVIHTGDKLN